MSRFVEAQRDTYDEALSELRAGSKRGHWMWFVFPQIAGLARSETARFYAIADRGEAEAYLRHAVLGRRLRECTEAVLGWAGRRRAEQILGAIDSIKFRSSMTLFEACGDVSESCAAALDVFYAGERDAATLSRLCR